MKLKEIISEYTGLATDEIKDQLSIKDNLGMDSLGLISMICEIERAFNVEIPDSALEKLCTLKDLRLYIEEHQAV